MAKTHRCGITMGWAERDEKAIHDAVSCIDHNGKKAMPYKKLQFFRPVEKSTFQVGDAQTGAN
ncbi:MAG: hypothetical protein ABJC87_09700 [Roseobacter sp.]